MGLMFPDLNAPQRELLARALDSFVGDVDAGDIPGVTLEQAEQLRSAVLPHLPTARLVERSGLVLLCGHDACEQVASRLVEGGYTRDWYLRSSGGAFTALDGLTAYSEDGDGNYTVTCEGSHVSGVPDGVFDIINWA